MTKPLSQWTLPEMEALYAELGSYRKCAAYVGVTHPTWIRHYEDRKNNQEEIVWETEIDSRYESTDVKQAITAVQEAGWFVTKKPLQRGYTFDLNKESADDVSAKIGIVSDTHIGSRYQQLESLWKFYEKCSREGITTILHCGDITDGYNMYPGQAFELFLQGEKAQTDYVVENYPHVDGIETLLVGGNHDESFWKKNGTDICYNISLQRPDILYKGFYLANFNIGNVNICLHHGDGGVAYARSYKLQKLAQAKFEDKNNPNPNILVVGHYHVTCVIPDYIGSYLIQMPCFQASTPMYMGRKGLNADIGGIILEFSEANGVLKTINNQYVRYPVVDDDY